MDPEAENFNPDATLEDASCVYARDKFIGSFIGSLSCPAPLPNSEGFVMVFSEGLNDVSQVEISFQNAAVPIPILVGTVEGNVVTIDEIETSIALDPNIPDIKTTLTFSGEGTIDSSGNGLTGSITVTIVLFGQTLTCEFTATKE